jgi:hypothetical protein
MENLYTNEHDGVAVESPVRTPAEIVIAGLESDLAQSRQETVAALGKLSWLRSSVREKVVEKIRDGTICRPGANEALEEWGIEPFTPRYRVNLRLDVSVELEADDESDAGYMATRSVTVSGDDDVLDVSLNDTHVMGIEEDDEY